jgi:hypothetical protein
MAASLSCYLWRTTFIASFVSNAFEYIDYTRVTVLRKDGRVIADGVTCHELPDAPASPALSG